MGTNPTAAILEGAKKTLANANKFTDSATSQAGNKVNPFAPSAKKPQAEATDYSHARTARKSSEFMGIKSDQAPEINTALTNREQAKKAMEQ